MARPDFRAAATARLNEERGQELSQNVLSLLAADDTTVIRPSAVRNIPVDRVDPNPNQPRLAMDKAGLDDLTASVQEHGVLQPILVRPLPAGRYQLVAGERRWRAATAAGLTVIPGPHRGDRRRDGSGDRGHREPPARGPLAARRSHDLRQDDPPARLQHPQAGPEARQGQGLSREPAPPGRRPGGDPRAGVCAQRHTVPRLRVAQGHGSEEAQEAGGHGGPGRALAGQAARADR